MSVLGGSWLLLVIVVVLYNLAELTNEKRIIDPDRQYSAWFAIVLAFDWSILEAFRNTRHAWRARKHDYVY